MKSYPKSERFDSVFVEENMMGPNPLCLLEDACVGLDLEPGTRILDLGCGKGLTSIFLAQEFDATVFATDLWEEPTENFKRFQQFQLDRSIIPIKAEATSLPYADEFFDAIFCIDSYNYFGADENYLGDHLLKLLKVGGKLVVVAPGCVEELTDETIAPLKGFFPQDQEELIFKSFHSPAWWAKLWEKDGAKILEASVVSDGRRLWNEWAVVAKKRYNFNDVEFLAADSQKTLTVVKIIAER